MAKLSLTDIQAGYAFIATYNANQALIETALENTLSRDGTTPNTMSADLDMNSKKVVNLATGSIGTDGVNQSQMNTAIAAAGASLPTGPLAAGLVTITDSGGHFASAFLEGALGEVFGSAQTITQAWTFSTNPKLTDSTKLKFGNSDDVTFTWNGTTFDVQAITSSNFRFRDGQVVLLYNSANTSFGSMSVFGTDFNWQGSTIDFYTMSNFDGLQLGKTSQSDAVSLAILERASAPSNIAGYGQLWVKNDSPNILVYTDDAGNEANAVLVTSGSFTPTHTGFSSAPTGDVYWVKQGNTVHVTFKFLTGTSNATSWSITNVPSAIQASVAQEVALGVIMDNSALQSSGSLSTGVGSTWTFKNWNSAGAAGIWVGSNSKGMHVLNQTISYRISETP